MYWFSLLTSIWGQCSLYKRKKNEKKTLKKRGPENRHIRFFVQTNSSFWDEMKYIKKKDNVVYINLLYASVTEWKKLCSE